LRSGDLHEGVREQPGGDRDNMPGASCIDPHAVAAAGQRDKSGDWDRQNAGHPAIRDINRDWRSV
jgi:hypothetical protein